MRHRFSGWPGAWCLDCGCEDPNEIEVATGRKVAPNHLGLAVCKEPNSKRHDPYVAAKLFERDAAEAKAR